MSELKFTKMQGAGNDYIYINCMESYPKDLDLLSVRLSDRHKGVGADGIVLIMPSETADFRMRMFNSDGSEGRMCGNAARCVGKYVYEKCLTAKTDLSLETLSGIKHVHLHLKESKVDRVTVDMGSPEFAPSLIPILSEHSKEVSVSTTIGLVRLTAVSIGNPHGVVFSDSDLIDVRSIGAELEVNPIFPEKANIEFVRVLSPTHLNVRVWERGSGETLACGTGACAAAVAANLLGKCERRVRVDMPGGRLDVEWSENDNHIYLTGPAEFSFEGKVIL